MKMPVLINLIVMGFVVYFYFTAINEAEAQVLKGRTMNTIVEGNNVFATELYAQAAKTSRGNLFFSPNSIHTSLGMTYLGAKGKTAQEMAEVLHLALNREQIVQAFGELTRTLNSPQMVLVEEYVDREYRQMEAPVYQLSIANALWVMKDYPFREEYITEVRGPFNAELRQLDFINDPEPSRYTINEWVENKTNQKIKELLPPGIIRNDTRLVLTNAIYFMSNWAEEFKKQNTKDLPFTMTDGSKVTCPQMFQQDRFGYMETNDFQGLSLPYKGHDLEMAIFLPKNTDGLPTLEKKFTVKNLNKWMSQFKHQEVKVTLPKFKFSYAASLGDVLKAMGMNLAFIWPGADFSIMTTAKDLFISAVLHKSFVAVDEEGTEAAAGTAVMMSLGAAPSMEKTEPKVFKADHPFIFVIRHKKTDAILFTGRLTNPKV
jgi:serpin B